MPQLREVASADALAAHQHQLAARRGRAALDTRLAQLEAQHAQFDRALLAGAQAVRSLPEANRPRMRRRLRELGLADLDVFADLRSSLDHAAA
jgi:hypothetical protein